LHKSIVISTPEADFSALAYKEEFESSIKKVAEKGFDVVELAVRDPEEIDTGHLQKILGKFDLKVSAIGTGQAYGEEGLSFTHPDKSIRDKAINRIKSQIDFAHEMGGVQVIIGLIRGKLGEEQSPEEAETLFLKCLDRCIDYDSEIVLTLEPINRYETNLYNTIAEMKEVINKLDKSDNIGILADTFHMNIEEAEIAGGFRRCSDLLTHVHVADSNRWAPGCGHIDFNEVISVLNEIDYKGAISAEILPKPDADRSAELAIMEMEKLGL